MNLSADDVAEVPPGVVTIRSAVPTSPGGEVTAQLVVVHMTLDALVEPKLAVVLPVTKPVPVTVTTVPPESGPTFGAIPVTVGIVS